MCELISVIVPVYNTGKYLKSCVDSILNQDYPSVEIILVDDGSNDSCSGKICDDLAEKNENIIVCHKPNGGSSSARNKGISLSHGAYVGFVDSDDVIDSKMYASLYKELITNDVNVVIGGIETTLDGRVIDQLPFLNSGLYNNNQILKYFFLGNWHSSCTNLYRKELFEDVLFPENEVNEDFILNYHIFKKQEKIYYDNVKYYHYIRRPGSNTNSPISVKFLDWLNHTSLVLSENSDNPNLANASEYQYIFSNIVLCNKSILTLATGPSLDADTVYAIASDNLKSNRKMVNRNQYLSDRYKRMGVFISRAPMAYKKIVTLCVKLKKLLCKKD